MLGKRVDAHMHARTPKLMEHVSLLCMFIYALKCNVSQASMIKAFSFSIDLTLSARRGLISYTAWRVYSTRKDA